MNQRRTAKISQAIKETVSTQILFGLKDPRIQNVTVTDVELSTDLRSAKILISVLGDEKQISLCLHGLRSARGFLQSKVGDRLQTRYIPILSFEVDDSLKRSAATAEIIREALANGITLPEDLPAEGSESEPDHEIETASPTSTEPPVNQSAEENPSE